jgi:hypothetical protein
MIMTTGLVANVLFMARKAFRAEHSETAKHG